jgi:hypothetical protein
MVRAAAEEFRLGVERQVHLKADHQFVTRAAWRVRDGVIKHARV